MTLHMEDGVWFDFHEQKIIKGQAGYQGISFRCRAGLGTEKKHINKSQIIEIDIDMGDIIVPEPQKTKLKPLLDKNKISWQIYKIETIIAEKLHGLFVFGSASSRAKDIFYKNVYFYFLVLLRTGPMIRPSVVKSSIPSAKPNCVTLKLILFMTLDFSFLMMSSLAHRLRKG